MDLVDYGGLYIGLEDQLCVGGGEKQQAAEDWPLVQWVYSETLGGSEDVIEK